jgi:hypothetical protein
MARTHTRTRIRLGAALVALAVAAPIASAKPIPGGDSVPEATPTAAPSVQAVVVTRDAGFDWTDAAIGGAAAAGLLGVAGAGLLAARRPGDDTGPAVGAH